MFNLSRFCCICLTPNVQIKDMHSVKENGLSFVEKLQACVPEIIWHEYKELPLCIDCIDKLNKVYEFKKLCMQTHSLYKKLAEMCKDNQANINKQSSPNSMPDQKAKRDKFSLTNTTISLVKSNNNNSEDKKQEQKSSKKHQLKDDSKSKLKNSSINGISSPMTYPKETSITVNDISISSISNDSLRSEKRKQKDDSNNSTKAMLESKSEEMSIEIDPMDYDLNEDSSSKDTFFNLSLDLADSAELQASINEKLKDEDNLQLHSGHFLTSNNNNSFVCEVCFKSFISYEMLWGHKMLHHNGIDELIKSDTLSETTITLRDLIESGQKLNNSATTVNADQIIIETNLKCSECLRYFSSARRLSRHIETYHSTRPPRKYFTKGTKNAKCDICNKEVSTQAYLQIHKRLHYRKGEYEACY